MHNPKLLVRLAGGLLGLALTLTAAPLIAQQEAPAAVDRGVL